MIDPAEFFRARMNVHQLDLRLRNIQHAVALRGHLAKATADQQQKVGAFHAREQFWIRPDAEVTGITRMGRVNQVTAPERRRYRQRESFGKFHKRRTCAFGPPATADKRHRTFCLAKQILQPVDLVLAGRYFHGREGRRIRHRDALAQHVFRKSDHDRPGTAIARRMKCTRNDFRDAEWVVYFYRSFLYVAEYRAIVEFLKGFALAHLATDLTNENNHR